MSETLTIAHVAETGASAYAVKISVSGYELIGDEPSASDGGDLGPAPYDMLLAALGECTAMTVRWYARRQNWPLERVEVDLTHQKQAVEGRSGLTDVFDKRIRLFGDTLTEAQKAKLVAVAAKCPVQKTLEGTPLIATAAV